MTSKHYYIVNARMRKELINKVDSIIRDRDSDVELVGGACSDGKYWSQTILYNNCKQMMEFINEQSNGTV